jgi:hypothetical protein
LEVLRIEPQVPEASDRLDVVNDDFRMVRGRGFAALADAPSLFQRAIAQPLPLPAVVERLDLLLASSLPADNPARSGRSELIIALACSSAALASSDRPFRGF